VPFRLWCWRWCWHRLDHRLDNWRKIIGNLRIVGRNRNRPLWCCDWFQPRSGAALGLFLWPECARQWLATVDTNVIISLGPGANQPGRATNLSAKKRKAIKAISGLRRESFALIPKTGAAQVGHATRDLTEYLDALAAEGFTFEPVKKENVPPCRF
jgi:hypothetical protein